MLDAWLDLVAGGSCVGCRAPGRPLCPSCSDSLPRQGHPVSPTPRPDGLAPCFAAGVYDDPLRAMVLAHKEHAVLALSDGVVVDGMHVPSGAMLYTAPGRTTVDVAAGESAVTAMLLGGEPFEEELLMWWNFVGRTHDDIADARKAWQVERELPRDDRTRFGFVDGHDGFSLPAPELPSVELKPRPRARPR